MSHESEHLTRAEMEAAVAGPDERHRKHLDICAECRNELNDLRDWKEKVRLLRTSPHPLGATDCPPPPAFSTFWLRDSK